MSNRKPIGSQNGLKRYVRLKAQKPINKVSNQQVKKNNMLNQSRKILKEQAGELCMICHKPPTFGSLQVHHKVFRSKGGGNEPSNLLLLCFTCHQKAHGLRV